MTTTTHPTYENLESLSPQLAESVLHWTLALADTKHRIGMQFSHWVTGTPALEAAVSAAAITQDELGHARALFSVLRHFPGAPESIGAENDLEARQIYYAPSALTPRWADWLQVVAINIVLDRALQLAIESLHGSTYTPLASCAGKMVQEERFHRIFGDSWLTRLGANAANRAALQQQINWAWAITDEWIGPDDDVAMKALGAAGIWSSSPSALRSRWQDEVTPLLAAGGFEQPACRTDWHNWRPKFRDIAVQDTES